MGEVCPERKRMKTFMLYLKDVYDKGGNYEDMVEAPNLSLAVRVFRFRNQSLRRWSTALLKERTIEVEPMTPMEKLNVATRRFI